MRLMKTPSPVGQDMRSHRKEQIKNNDQACGASRGHAASESLSPDGTRNRFWLRADNLIGANVCFPSGHSLDHLVGECKHLCRQIDTERLGSLEINDQFELGRLYNRQIGGLLAFENPPRIDADLAKRTSKVASIAHEPAGRGIGAAIVDRRKLVARRELDDLIASAEEIAVDANDERSGPLANKGSKRGVDFSRVAGFEDDEG